MYYLLFTSISISKLLREPSRCTILICWYKQQSDCDSNMSYIAHKKAYSNHEKCSMCNSTTIIYYYLLSYSFCSIKAVEWSCTLILKKKRRNVQMVSVYVYIKIKSRNKRNWKEGRKKNTHLARYEGWSVISFDWIKGIKRVVGFDKFGNFQECGFLEEP